MVTFSTISGNSASDGGGIWNNNDNDAVTIDHTIVAGNRAFSSGPDIRSGSGLFVNFSLVGNNSGSGLGEAQTADANGNLIGRSTSQGGQGVIDPLLGPLGSGIGATETYALLAGSPAIDAGDPSIMFDSAEFDQRGAPFVRVFDGGVAGQRIDIGATERQTLLGFNQLVVDTTVDEDDGDFSAGDLSLREAVALANSTPVDTIMFDATVFSTPQTIFLSLGEIVIAEAVTVDGPGSQLVTIDAQQQSRIFNIVVTTGDFTLAGLTLTGGRTTGDGSSFSGGAVRSLTTGNLTIDQSTVSGNSTADALSPGGGVFAEGDVTLTNSTVSGNSTASFFAPGGGVFNPKATSRSPTAPSAETVRPALDAPGGGVFSEGDVTLTNSTVTNNEATHATATGGGISNRDGTIIIDGSIVAGNTAGGGSPDIDPGTGTFTVNFSLLGTGVSPNSGSGNLFDDIPLLGPLANNGGPTQTHELLAGSPAINAGDPLFSASPNFDQRGAPFVRVVGFRVDIGAFERQFVDGLNLTVDSNLDEFDNDFSAGNLSLREAIGLAEGSDGADTITFASSLSGQTITLGGSELEITETLTIDATSLSQNVTIDANNASRIFNFTASTGRLNSRGTHTHWRTHYRKQRGWWWHPLRFRWPTESHRQFRHR